METCKLHAHTVERMDQFFADTAAALRKADVLDARVNDIKKDQDDMVKRIDTHEARISNLEKLSAVTENTLQSSLESLAKFGRELDKYSTNLAMANNRFAEIEKHMVLLTFKVGLGMSIFGGVIWFVVNKYVGG